MPAATSGRRDDAQSEHALLGRDRHVRELRLLLDALVDGRGNLVLIAGDAGMGKTLPMWRFQLQGPAAISQYFTEQMAPLSNLHCTQLRELVTGDSVSVESECRFDAPNGAGLWRCIDVLRIVGDEIVEHTQYCTGYWAPTDIARQSAEAPMVRW